MVGVGGEEGGGTVQEFTVSQTVMVEIVSAGRVCPAVLQTLQLSHCSQTGQLVAVTGDNLQAAGAVRALTGGDGPLQLHQVRTGGQEVAVSGQSRPRLNTVEGGEVTGGAELTEVVTLTNITHITLTTQHTLRAQSTREVRGEALARLQH